MTYQFEVPGEPVPWQRVGRDPRYGHAYVPEQTKRHKQKIQFCALTARVRKIEGPIHLSYVFYVSKPPTFTNRDGDGDNFEKSVWDALKGIAFKDDGQVKSWCGLILHDAERPRTVVTIESMEEPEDT